MKDDAVKPAAHDAWNILTQVLADRAWVWIILGVITLVGVWFVGETDAPLRRAMRRRLCCRAARRPTASPQRALLVVVLVAPQLARGWLSALVLIGLVVAGIEVVRAIVNREAQHPD